MDRKKIDKKADKQIKDYLKKTIKPTFVNIGDYDGKDCINFQKMNKDIICYAIEACYKNYNIILNNLKEYNNMYVVNVALSDSNGDSIFYTSQHSKSTGTSQANSLYQEFLDGKDWAKNIEEIKIKTLTMDSFCSQYNIEKIDLLKINCEGCEYKIFNSDSLNFLNFTENIDLYLHGKSSVFCSRNFLKNKIKIIDLIEDAGFVLSAGLSRENVLKTKQHVRQLWSKK